MERGGQRPAVWRFWNSPLTLFFSERTPALVLCARDVVRSPPKPEASPEMVDSAKMVCVSQGSEQDPLQANTNSSGRSYRATSQVVCQTSLAGLDQVRRTMNYSGMKGEGVEKGSRSREKGNREERFGPTIGSQSRSQPLQVLELEVLPKSGRYHSKYHLFCVKGSNCLSNDVRRHDRPEV